MQNPWGGQHVTGEPSRRNAGDGATADGNVPTAGDDQWLVALYGLPGVGKSTVAEYVTDHLGAAQLRTDVIRKELFDEPVYSDEETEAVYRELHERADDQLAAGNSVVLDATFADADHREGARSVADHQGVAFRPVKVVCEQEIAERRIATRDDVSDADVSVYHRFQSEFDPVDGEYAVVDNSGSKAETYRQVDGLF